jgi:hypothetical protein
MDLFSNAARQQIHGCPTLRGCDDDQNATKKPWTLLAHSRI